MPTGDVHKRKFSRNLAILLAIFGFCALVWMITMVKMAHAGEIVDAGQPYVADLDTEVTQDYPDIYARQLAYSQENRKYHEQLKERQRNFIAPMNEVRRNYDQNRNALHNAGRGYNP